MPGRIIQAIQQAGTNNPLIMLDEIDKVGADFRGDPSVGSARSARSGAEFFVSRQLSRRYVRSFERDVHDDGEHLDTIQPALRDRMEMISLSGYTEEEKLEIARRHLIPKQIEENGLGKGRRQI